MGETNKFVIIFESIFWRRQTSETENYQHKAEKKLQKKFENKFLEAIKRF